MGDLAPDLRIENLRASREQTGGLVKATPLLPFEALSRDSSARDVRLKAESLQPTGSFKLRGAVAKLGTVEPECRGVTAGSAGNHGLALAYTAQRFKLPCSIHMPAMAPVSKVQAVERLGASVIQEQGSVDESIERARRHAEAEGLLFVHPFDDPVVIAAQGTLALELLEDAPDITDVIASIGGGGMISGVATVVQELKPGVRVWGVETVGADAMSQALAAGEPVELPAITSIAKTLGAPAVCQRTLDIVRDRVEEVLLVPDADAVRAIEVLAQRSKILAEPAAACTWAAALDVRDRLPPDARVALVFCGGNVSLDDVERWRRELLPGSTA